MANGDKLPMSDGQRNHSVIADVEESLARFALVRCPLRFVLDADESNSQRSDPRTSATGTVWPNAMQLDSMFGPVVGA